MTENMSKNCFSGIGKIERDPRQMQTPTGKAYIKFQIAIPRARDNEGKVKVDRISCAAWGKVVESAKYFEAGDVVAVSGWIQTTNYQKDGQWVNTWEVNLADTSIVKKTNPARSAEPSQPVAPPPPPPPPPVEAAPPPEIYGDPFDIY